MDVKKALKYGAVAFVVFYLFTRPVDAAEVVRTALSTITTGAERLAEFFSKVLT